LDDNGALLAEEWRGHRLPLVVQSINLLSMMPLRIFCVKLLNFPPLTSPLKPSNDCRRYDHGCGYDDKDKKADPIVLNQPFRSIGIEAMPGTDLVDGKENHRDQAAYRSDSTSQRTHHHQS
jgi:hypothetical protein